MKELLKQKVSKVQPMYWCSRDALGIFVVPEVVMGNTKKAQLLKINKEIKNSGTANLECIY